MTLPVTLITERAALSRMEGAWWDLWHAAEATPFQSPAWLMAWWDAFLPGELLILAILDDDRLCALAPFYRDGGVVRPIGVSASDYLDVLIDRAVSETAAPALSRAISQFLRDGVERWELPDMRPGSTAWDLAPDAVMDDSDDQPCPVLFRATSPDSLRAAIPAGKRRKLRMAGHRAKRGGGGVIARVTGDAALPAFDALVALHSQRWAEDGGGVLSDARTIAFHRAAIPALDRAGLLDLFTCMSGEEMAGVYYGLRDSTRAYAYIGGYDRQQGNVSPGSRLIGHAIESACQDGLREFHFLRGAEAYKYEWGAVDVMNRRRVFRPARVNA